jgi:uncharacterized surface protein with fasciclin (FAS1) repeats
MKLYINKWLKSAAYVAGAISLLASCNKDLPTAEPNPSPSTEGSTLTELLNGADFTILKAAVARAVPAATSGYTPLNTLFSDRTGEFTLFAPVNTAFAALGVTTPAQVAGFRPGQLDTLLRYHVVGGQRFLYTSTSTATTFPNFQFPTQLVLAPPSATLPPGLRMSIFPSKRNGTWVNNIPVTQPDQIAANGVIHKAAAIVAPPSQFLWNRIDTDPDLTYLKAAIKKADDGVAATDKLETALQNPAANFTLFAPTNVAFQTILTGLITQALVAQGIPATTAATQAATLASSPDVFTNAQVASVLTRQTVQGIVVYHLLAFDPIVSGTTVTVNGLRAFTPNFPTTSTSVKTFLNKAVVAHPGVTVQATFGTLGVTAASVKGVANPTASNVLINSATNINTSDQHYINGVLHKIDQVLRPQ